MNKKKVQPITKLLLVIGVMPAMMFIYWLALEINIRDNSALPYVIAITCAILYNYFIQERFEVDDKWKK
ncbi:hypothetical protein F400_gp113 [Bacillus phage BCD7]|uniref:Uncharacterized protein n=1 Tax=Bacillus phage BCD7 TaxID=1136534 RepID=J9PVC9_9CAUD|nr:hypothetical protein F400_gp113 [Bacillus phage BCD7]AEZ50560.1 hypothetical protein BCD7_0113 [Bacillus phage BCD7]